MSRPNSAAWYSVQASANSARTSAAESRSTPAGSVGGANSGGMIARRTATSCGGSASPLDGTPAGPQQGRQLHAQPLRQRVQRRQARAVLAVLLQPPYDVDGDARLLGQPLLRQCGAPPQPRDPIPRCSAAIPRRYAEARTPGCLRRNRPPG